MGALREILVVIVCVGAVGATWSRVYAGPVLLATMNTGAGFASDERLGPQWPALFHSGTPDKTQIVLFEQFELGDDFPMDIQNTVSGENDPDFEGFVALLTDGTGSGDISEGAWGENGPIILGGGPEESVLNRLTDFHVPRLGVDFVGYEITYITQDLTVVMESDWLGPDGHVYATYWAFGGDYEFYGVPVPEPATWMLLVLGSVALLRRPR